MEISGTRWKTAGFEIAQSARAAILARMSNPKHLLTPGEAGQVLRLPTVRVTRLARAGEIPAIILPGDEIRFKLDDLWAWIDTHRPAHPSGSNFTVQM